MAKKDELYVFIKSLTKGERKGLSQFLKSQSQNSSNEYFELYNIYQAQNNYNSKHIQNAFKGRNFHQTKAYLLSLIEEYLIKVKSQTSNIFVMRKILNEYWINMERSNLKRAEKKIKKAIEFGEENEMYNQLQGALNGYLSFLFSFQPYPKEELLKLTKEIARKSEINMLKLDIHQYFQRFNIHFLEHNLKQLSKEEINDLIAEIDQRMDSPYDLGCWINVYALRNKLALYEFLDDKMNAASNAFKAIEILEQHPSQLMKNLGSYTSSLVGAINACIAINDLPKLEQCILKLINLNNQFKKGGVVGYEYYKYACNNVVTSLVRNDFELTVLQQLITVNNTLNNIDNKYWKCHIELEKTVKLFLKQDYQKCIIDLNNFLSNKEYKPFSTESGVAQLLLLLAVLKKENLRHLRNILKNTLDYFKAFPLPGKSFGIFFNSFQSFDFSKNNTIEFFLKCNKELSDVQDQPQEWENIFDLKEWVKSHV